MPVEPGGDQAGEQQVRVGRRVGAPVLDRRVGPEVELHAEERGPVHVGPDHRAGRLGPGVQPLVGVHGGGGEGAQRPGVRELTGHEAPALSPEIAVVVDERRRACAGAGAGPSRARRRTAAA